MRGRAARGRAALAIAVVPLLASCSEVRNQSALDPAGPQSGRVAGLLWFAFSVAAAVYLATMGSLAWAAWQARRRERTGAPLRADSERRMTVAVSAAVGVTVLILLVYLVYDFSVGRRITARPSTPPLVVEVIGHQWWWEVHYADSAPQGRTTTANELHVPVGQPVVLQLTSRDVIHSIWVPNLAGKKDLVPGYAQSIWFQADTPGVYRGQCAEFCGHQHAKMALFVIAEPRERFVEWLAAQRRPAAAPTDPVARRGQEIFLAGSCMMCHAISGTAAASTAGPDLTHLASRRTIAAGTLPNTRGNLAGWILDPQRVKPGSHMPPNTIPAGDLEALLTYLQSLK